MQRRAKLLNAAPYLPMRITRQSFRKKSQMKCKQFVKLVIRTFGVPRDGFMRAALDIPRRFADSRQNDKRFFCAPAPNDAGYVMYPGRRMRRSAAEFHDDHLEHK